MINRLKKIFLAIIEYFDQSIVGNSVKRFGVERGPVYAAGLAFYAFFSLFPLFLLLISIASVVLKKYMSSQEIADFIFENIPIFQEFIKDNILQVVKLRGKIGVVGLISLMWSSTGYFQTLIRSINMAWKNARERNFFLRRLAALGMVSGIAVLLMMAFFATLVLDLLSHYQVPISGSITLYGTFLWRLLIGYLPLLLGVLIFWLLYFITPNIKVSKRSAFLGALFASFTWNLLNSAFKLYLRGGLVNYELVYGSLSTIVSFLLWIYLSNWILLYGAYFSASIDEKINRIVF